jgi:hypothetical protein
LAGLDDLNFYEGESDCTSETGAGQFSIFGAVEEKDGHGFSRSDAGEAMEEETSVGALDGAVFAHDLRW